ncbi:MAG: hypothetical protein EAZ07_02770 [Cytophagales bacterium]|nr:MAG: hypothetical protein EAZ07_02770 [Cytophagales bacterium]
MKLKFIKYWFLFLLFSYLSLCPLLNALAQEQLLKIHTDKRHYFIGDTIWLNAHVLQEGKLTKDNKVKLAQLLLVDRSRKVAQNIKIRITDGLGNCHFTLDSSLAAGVYTLYSFVPIKEKQEHKAFATPILISRLENRNTQSLFSIRKEDTIAFSGKEKSGLLKHKIIDFKFQKNESGKFKIILKDNFGTPSKAKLSVSIQNILYKPLYSSVNDTIVSIYIHRTNANAYTGISLKAAVKYEKETPAELNSILFTDTAAFSDVRFQIFGNSNPSFSISNLKVFGTKEMNLELQKNYGQKVTFEIIQDSFDISFAYQRIDSFDINQLIFFKKAQKIFDEPTQLNKPSVLDKKSLQLTNNPVIATYDFTKYIEFNTMLESMNEISSVVKISKNKEDIKIRISDGYNKLYFSEQPIFIIDGRFTFDNKTIIALNPRNVKTLEVIHPSELTKEWKGIAPNGILKVNTIHANQELEYSENRQSIDFNGYAHDEPTLANHSKKHNQHYPNFAFRPYWNSTLHTNQEGEAIIDVALEDQKQYVCTIHGITDDGKYFEIQQLLLIP